VFCFLYGVEYYHTFKKTDSYFNPSDQIDSLGLRRNKQRGKVMLEFSLSCIGAGSPSRAFTFSVCYL
jgi:hypothetical protein